MAEDKKELNSEEMENVSGGIVSEIKDIVEGVKDAIDAVTGGGGDKKEGGGGGGSNEPSYDQHNTATNSAQQNNQTGANSNAGGMNLNNK